MDFFDILGSAFALFATWQNIMVLGLGVVIGWSSEPSSVPCRA